VKDHFSEAFKARKESFAVIGFGEFFYKSLQVRILGYHKSGDWDVQLARLRSHCVAFVYDILIESIAVFVILAIWQAQTTGLAVGNHKNLLVGVALSAQDIHSKL
jgi:hypothetical protein